jgi:hypothetical protein
MKNQPTSTTRLLQCIHTSTGGVSIVVDDIEIGDVTVDVCNKGSNEAWVTDVTTCDCSCTLSTGVRGVAVVVISIVDATLVEVVAATATAVSKRDPRPRPRRPFRCNTGGHPRTVTAISSLIATPAPTNRVPRRMDITESKLPTATAAFTRDLRELRRPSTPDAGHVAPPAPREPVFSNAVPLTLASITMEPRCITQGMACGDLVSVESLASTENWRRGSLPFPRGLRPKSMIHKYRIVIDTHVSSAWTHPRYGKRPPARTIETRLQTQNGRTLDIKTPMRRLHFRLVHYS